MTAGIDAAVARAQQIACDAVVRVAAGTIAGHALDAGPLDVIGIDLVPIVMGSGHRYVGDSPVDVQRLGDPVDLPAPPVAVSG